MAANWFEQGLDLNVWKRLGKCSTCGGVVKYKYKIDSQPDLLLHIFPNKKRFELVRNDRGKTRVERLGNLADMETLLENI